MTAFEKTLAELQGSPRRWLVTGAAGFIGSNLVEFLLRHGQWVVGFDNFATGHRHNLEEVRLLVGDAAWQRFRFQEGDLSCSDQCRTAVEGVDAILHQGALGSVPLSIEHPVEFHAANVTGTLHLLRAAKDLNVKRFVYASSAAIYGDEPSLPAVEGKVGRCLSPYAATKVMDELYADVFSRCYGLQAVGFRYFNVFGPRQDPQGAYASVIPKWIASLLDSQPVFINGDGETSRDFCHVLNVVQANVLAGWRPQSDSTHAVYNVALGERTTLNQLFQQIQSSLASQAVAASVATTRPVYRDFRIGDVRHSLADISAVSRDLGYAPTHSVARGLAETIEWYVADYQRRVRS